MFQDQKQIVLDLEKESGTDRFGFSSVPYAHGGLEITRVDRGITRQTTILIFFLRVRVSQYLFVDLSTTTSSTNYNFGFANLTMLMFMLLELRSSYLPC